MTLHDFFQEEIIPFFKGDYQNFSSKAVDGYSLFITKWDKVPRQAMITPEAQVLLQRIFEKYSVSTDSKEDDLQTSQVSRWYVNGFTLAYNYSRRYDLYHPYEHTDFVPFAEKLKSSDDVERGEWDFYLFRKYTINLGRREGTLFYVTEKEICNCKIEDRQGDLSIGNVNNPSLVVSKEETEYDFSEKLLKEIYDTFNGKVFQKVSSLDEFKNIIMRKPRTEHLSGFSRKNMQMYKLLYNFSQMLSEKICDTWLEDIAEEGGYNVDKVNKKHNGSESSSTKYQETMKLIDDIFSKYRHP